MPSSRICSARSRASSARRSSRSAPAPWAREIYAAAAPLVQKSKHHNHLEFLAHGMGMVSHEGAAAHRSRAGALSERIRATSRWRRAWWSRSRPRCCIRARLHQARGHRRRHRQRPRDLRRRRARLEQGGHGLRRASPRRTGVMPGHCAWHPRCCEPQQALLRRERVRAKHVPSRFRYAMSGDLTASLSRRSPPPSRATAAPPSPGSRTAAAA